MPTRCRRSQEETPTAKHLPGTAGVPPASGGEGFSMGLLQASNLPPGSLAKNAIKMCTFGFVTASSRAIFFLKCETCGNSPCAFDQKAYRFRYHVLLRPALLRAAGFLIPRVHVRSGARSKMRARRPRSQVIVWALGRNLEKKRWWRDACVASPSIAWERGRLARISSRVTLQIA
jgi:hypothetical protein